MPFAQDVLLRGLGGNVRIGEFDALSAAGAERELLACCAAPRWAREVAARRPYGTSSALHTSAHRALTDADLDAALAGHPRIGDRTAGGVSRVEQSRVAGARADVLSALAAGNRAYEERFGHVYLVCAAGRDAEDLLATLHARLYNDPTTERGVALRELAAINRLRLDRLLACDVPGPGSTAPGSPAPGSPGPGSPSPGSPSPGSPDTGSPTGGSPTSDAPAGDVPRPATEAIT